MQAATFTAAIVAGITEGRIVLQKLELSIAMGDYDRTRPIVDGTVTIDGVRPLCALLSPEEMFFRAFRHHDFDVSELSLSSYCLDVARGKPHYVGIPVFLSRAFRHTSVYVRTDRGIATPADLAGRRIGIAEYQLTANVWVRGILEADHGVAPRDILWVRGGLHQPGRPEKIAFEPPAGVQIENAPAGSTLDKMLVDGDIDGLIGPRAPRCFAAGHPQVGRLFADSVAAAADHYRRTAIFPIMHLVGLRRSLADAHPWLPATLLKAFSDAKGIAEAALADTSATKVTMPFVEDNLAYVRELMGDEPWSYGVERNRHVLDAFCDMHHAQGLSPRRLDVDELFHASTLEQYSV